MKFLTLLLQKAPVMHMSFASEPSGAFMNKLIVWLRANMHPQMFVSVGLQPSIAAGCIVRTANRQFDFSLRQALEDQKETFIKSISDSTVKEAAK
jgi:F0F1-type ATP synthase delta subunit